MKKSSLFLLLVVLCLFACKDDPEPLSNPLVSVTPNPTTDTAKIIVSNNKDKLTCTLQVFDTKGEIILEETFTDETREFDISLVGKPNGDYRVLVTAKKGSGYFSLGLYLTKTD